jgi:hypothetical protein
VILLAHQVIRSLPAPVLGALDAWSRGSPAAAP